MCSSPRHISRSPSFSFVWKVCTVLFMLTFYFVVNMQAFMRRNKGYGGFDAIAEDAVNRVIDAFVFLKKVKDFDLI